MGRIREGPSKPRRVLRRRDFFFYAGPEPGFLLVPNLQPSRFVATRRGPNHSPPPPSPVYREGLSPTRVPTSPRPRQIRPLPTRRSVRPFPALHSPPRGLPPPPRPLVAASSTAPGGRYSRSCR